jgi:hypothetical protein|tara:strand:+ start:2623 stop:3366 length:744 start_codon:yes stop_codon:yes gene_type:complete
METFGTIKNKILIKLTESYGDDKFKEHLNKVFRPIMENESLKELYSLYEEIETMSFGDKETAIIYVDEISKVLNTRYDKMTDTFHTRLLKTINEHLKDVECKPNELYEHLDTLLIPDTLTNISKKVLAKKKLVEHLTTPKTIENVTFKSVNENLLNSVLVNNFNVSYDEQLTENEREKLKDYMSLSGKEIQEKFSELKESVYEKLDTLSEGEKDFTEKSKQVKDEVGEMGVTRYNLFRLEDLSNNLI